MSVGFTETLCDSRQRFLKLSCFNLHIGSTTFTKAIKIKEKNKPPNPQTLPTFGGVCCTFDSWKGILTSQ